MLEQLTILKNRLKLKRLSIKIRKMSDEHFGYDPSDNPEFELLLEQRDGLWLIVQNTDRVWLNEAYEPHEYEENWNAVCSFV